MALDTLILNPGPQVPDAQQMQKARSEADARRLVVHKSRSMAASMRFADTDVNHVAVSILNDSQPAVKLSGRDDENGMELSQQPSKMSSNPDMLGQPLASLRSHKAEIDIFSSLPFQMVTLSFKDLR